MATKVHLGLYSDFQRAQRVGRELHGDADVDFVDIAILVKRDDPNVYEKYHDYFDITDKTEATDDESLMEKLNPFSDDDDEADENSVESLPYRNRTILFVKNDGAYKDEAVREIMQKHEPIELDEESSDDAWIGTGWLKNADKPEEVQAGDESIQDRRYRSFDWEKGEQI